MEMIAQVYNNSDRDFGAINIQTGEYSLARYSIKSQEYKCPSCDEKLKLKKGTKRRHHWCHYNQDTKCDFYFKNDDNTNNEKLHESLIHKECKSILKKMMKEKSVTISRKCATGQCDISLNIILEPLNENCILIEEYPLNFINTIGINRKIRADLVRIENDKLIEIYEIYATHQTREEDRPNNINWYEFNTDQIYEKYNDENYYLNDTIILNCCRHIIKCDECINEEKKILKRMNLLKEQLIQKELEMKKEEEEKEKNKRIICYNCGCKKPDNIYKNCISCNTKLQQLKIKKNCIKCDKIIYVNKECYNYCWDCNKNKINLTR